jgi:hypothetical protein
MSWRGANERMLGSTASVLPRRYLSTSAGPYSENPTAEMKPSEPERS